MQSHYDVPKLDDVLLQLAGAKLFGLLNANDGFNQVLFE